MCTVVADYVKIFAQSSCPHQFLSSHHKVHMTSWLYTAKILNITSCHVIVMWYCLQVRVRSAVQSTSDPTYVYSPYSQWVEVRGIIIEGKFVQVHVNVFYSFFLIPCPPLSQCLLEVSYNICFLFIIIDFFVYMFLSLCSLGIAPSKDYYFTFLIKLQSVSLCSSVPLSPSVPPSPLSTPSLPTSISPSLSTPSLPTSISPSLSPSLPSYFNPLPLSLSYNSF